MQFQSQLDRYYFEKYIIEIAIATLEKGGTASRVDSYQFVPPVDAWEFPKYPGRTAILPPEVDLVEELRDFIIANESFLRESDCWLGTWVNSQTKNFYFDITTSRSDIDEARKTALEFSDRDGRKIVALYNPKRNETVYL